MDNTQIYDRGVVWCRTHVRHFFYNDVSHSACLHLLTCGNRCGIGGTTCTVWGLNKPTKNLLYCIDHKKHFYDGDRNHPVSQCLFKTLCGGCNVASSLCTLEGAVESREWIMKNGWVGVDNKIHPADPAYTVAKVAPIVLAKSEPISSWSKEETARYHGFKSWNDMAFVLEMNNERI